MRLYTADEVHAALDYPTLINALRDAFQAGGEKMPVRQAYEVGMPGLPAHLLTMPAWRRGNAIGVKLVTVVPGNASRNLGAVSSLYVLFDGVTGVPRAIIDGEAMTNRRTAAASALAASYLAREDASTLLMVGTGHLVPHLIAAHASVRPISRVLIWGRKFDKAQALASKLTRPGLRVEAVNSIEEGLQHADIVSAATTSTEPLIFGAAVRPGTHVDLVGAFNPGMRESDDALVARSVVYVDTLEGALREAGDLLFPIKNGAFAAERIVGDLFGLTQGAVPVRQNAEQITLFKSVGAALEDLVAAELTAKAGG
ncbi:ornithine cyclodeaminase family protein [Pigmentiphaga aceris]|uniref:Ornithine cyclodeaminase family protein n=1 Tax=Pigmentiphaga aceris TaxID=1940612 RepID=A0A5C0B2U1_9BURK|nr:ornithine cyclodeaminase family protein [Pigmentiphaga aceris]QEI07510.1 ornithine cyclodeaminase family protein [Pigmentiphaga aceris]